MPFNFKSLDRESASRETKDTVDSNLGLDQFLLLSKDGTSNLTQAEILRNYHKSPPLHMAVSAIGRAVNDVEYMWEEENSPSQFSLKKPNRWHTQSDFFGLIAKYLALVGECFLVKKESLEGIELIPIPPHIVEELESGEYTLTIELFESKNQFEEDELVIVREPSLLDPYNEGDAVGKAIGTEIDIHEFSAEYTATFINNNSRPDMLISINDAHPDDVERLQSSLKGGPQHAGKSAAFPGADIQVEPLQQSFDELGLDDIRKYSSEVVRQAYGIPPEIVGIVENSNRATINSAEMLFKKNVIRPKVSKIVQTLNAEFVENELGEEFAIETGEIVPDNKQFRLKVMKEFPAEFSAEEIRELAGFEDEL